MVTRLSQVLAAAVGLLNLYLLFLIVKSVFGMFATWKRMAQQDMFPMSSGEAFNFAFGGSDSYLEFVDALLFEGMISVAAIIGLLIFNFIAHGKVTIWPK